MSNKAFLKKIRKISKEAIEFGALRRCKHCGKLRQEHGIITKRNDICIDHKGSCRYPVTYFE